jgi:ADP-ribose pyrophosphatase YjhB (NUDIX family)
MLHLIPRPLHRLVLRVADPLRRRVWRILRPRLRSVSVIALAPGERILLIRLSYGVAAWTFPGGGIRRGEAPEEAARREAKEEADCELDGLKLVAQFEEDISGARATSWLFAGNLLSNPVPDGREVLEARLFPLHSLPEPLSRRTQVRLQRWREWRSAAAS